MQRTILVVESNPGVLIVARNVLARAGHRVLTTGQLEEALERLAEDAPDLLLIDAQLAAPDFLPLLSEARGEVVPIVLLVHKGEETQPYVRMVRDEAAARFAPIAALEKPFASDLLLATVAQLLAPPPKKKRVKAPEVPAKPVADLPPLPAEGVTIDELEEPPWIGSVPSFDTSTDEAALPVEVQHIESIEPDRGDVLLTGRLGLVAVDAVLQLAERTPAAVCCRFERGEDEVEVAFADGLVAWARKSGAPVRPPSMRESARSVLRRSTEEIVYALLGWRRGRFTILVERTGRPELTGVHVGLRLQHLLLEGMRRLDEDRRRSTSSSSHR